MGAGSVLSFPTLLITIRWPLILPRICCWTYFIYIYIWQGNRYKVSSELCILINGELWFFSDQNERCIFYNIIFPWFGVNRINKRLIVLFVNDNRKKLFTTKFSGKLYCALGYKIVFCHFPLGAEILWTLPVISCLQQQQQLPVNQSRRGQFKPCTQQ